MTALTATTQHEESPRRRLFLFCVFAVVKRWGVIAEPRRVHFSGSNRADRERLKIYGNVSNSRRTRTATISYRKSIRICGTLQSEFAP
jgi:hypothetical protein